MIRRLSELLPGLEERFHGHGWRVQRSRNALLRVNAAGEDYVIDGLERTGPVYWPHPRDWIARCGEGQPILLTMGFFPQTPLRKFLDLGPHPRRIGRTATDPLQVLEEALATEGLTPQETTRGWCQRSPIVSCAECESLPCRSHSIACPLCGAKSCHPDVAKCHFNHEC